MAQPTYRDIISDIKKGNTAPVYLLMGEEDYYIDLLVNAFENNIVAPEDRDFNLNVYFGSDADMEIVVASAQQLPLMAPKRLVLLKEAQGRQNAKQALEKLAPYVAHPNDTTVFVVVFKGDNLNATSQLMKSATKVGAVVFKSPRLKDYQLPAQVKDYCAGNKTGIDDKAVEMLCSYIGGPLTKLFGEVNKLILIKGPGNRITTEDVEKHIGISKDFNNFELVSAIANKDYPKAIRIVNYFRANYKANPTILTTPHIFNFFSKIVIAHYLTDKSEEGIRTALGIKFAPQWREFQTAMRNYNAMKAFNAIHYIREFDVKTKGVGSFQNEYDLLQELIFKIFT